MSGSKYYNVRCNNASASGMYEVYPGCCELLFINQGDETCLMNNVILKPYPTGQPDLVGSVFAITCNEGELYGGMIQLIFDGTGSAPLVQIIQRIYTEAPR